IENKITNRTEAAFEQEIGRRFEQARADAKMLTELQKTGVRMDAAVGNIGGEIIQGLRIARLVVGILDPHTGTAAACFSRRVLLKCAISIERTERHIGDRFIGPGDENVKNRQRAFELL